MDRGSYRPWRDARYLDVLLDLNFLPNDEARESAQSIPSAHGTLQTLFPPNPDTPRFKAKNPDEDLLRSLPYGGEQ